MTTTELTALNTETLNEFRAERTLANISRRAATLFQDGYRARPVAEGLYAVVSPAGDIYTVRLSEDPAPFGSYCSCPCFEQRHTCKHLEGLVLAVEEGRDAPAEADGFDPYEYEFRNFCGEGVN